MRHDTHFVDQLVRPSGEAIGRLIPIEDVQPNPRQPRQTLGDLTDLVASVREKGILEPLLVRKVGGHYEIIAGERRYRAAVEVGLEELPCIIRETSDAEMMELALIENLQRKDLSPFEEADGLQVLTHQYGYTHETMAEKIGKSRTSITETLALAAMPEAVREECRRADIQSKSTLLQIVRQGSTEKMSALVKQLSGGEGATRAEARRLARPGSDKGRGRPRNFVFKFTPREKTFSLSLQFKRSQVRREEVIATLESILKELRGEAE